MREDTYNGEVRFSGRWDANRPVYKPEFWDRIQDLDKNTNTEDPILKCQPQGLRVRVRRPRSCRPRRRSSSSTAAITSGSSRSDGRAHDPQRAKDIYLLGRFGRQVGRRHARHRLGWLQRSDLARARRLHPPDNLHVVERFRREGNAPELRGHGGRRLSPSAVDPGAVEVAAEHQPRRRTSPKASRATTTTRKTSSGRFITDMGHETHGPRPRGGGASWPGFCCPRRVRRPRDADRGCRQA